MLRVLVLTSSPFFRSRPEINREADYGAVSATGILKATLVFVFNCSPAFGSNPHSPPEGAAHSGFPRQSVLDVAAVLRMRDLYFDENIKVCLSSQSH